MLSYRIEKERNRIENWLGIGLMLGLFLPHTSTLFLMTNPILCLIYKFYFKGNSVRFEMKYLVIVSFLLTLLLNIGSIQALKPLLEFANIFLLFFLFPIVGDVKVKKIFLYLSLLFIILSQFVYLLNISFLVYFMDKAYPFDVSMESTVEHTRNVSMDTVVNYRLGGLYRNPNQCCRYVTFLLCIFLLENKDEKLKRNLFFIALSFMSILITGSRTGIAVWFVIIGYFILVSENIKKKYKYAGIFLFIILLVGIIIEGSSKYRGLNVVDGFNGSADLKWMVLVDYLTHESSAIKLMLGYLDSTRFVAQDTAMYRFSFDAEYGYLIFRYGFVGLINVLLFYFVLYREFDNKFKMIFIMLLWSVSSTILFSYRMSFLFVLFLSKYYTQSRLKARCRRKYLIG